VVTRPSEQTCALAWHAIDAQHRGLFRRIDEIKRIVEAQEIEALAPLLRTFRQEVGAHFRHEEGVMKRHAYPFYEAHKARHDELVANLEAALSQPPGTGSLKLFLEITRHLTEELQHCVADDDHLRGFLSEA